MRYEGRVGWRGFFQLRFLNLKTEMAEGESAAVIGPTRHPASRVASSYRCNRCEPGSLVEPSTTPSSSLSISVSRIKHRGPSVMLAVCRDKAFGVEEPVGGEDVVVVFSNGGFDGIHRKLLEVL
jgi:hypothetical protein